MLKEIGCLHPSEPVVPSLHSVPSFFVFAFRITFPENLNATAAFCRQQFWGRRVKRPLEEPTTEAPGGHLATASLGLGAMRLSSQPQPPSSTVCPEEEGGSAFFLGANLSLRSQLARQPLERGVSKHFRDYSCPKYANCFLCSLVEGCNNAEPLLGVHGC